MDAHLGYEKNSVTGNNTGNSRNGSYPKKIQTEHGEAVISIPRDRNGQFEPIAVPKHESRGLSIEKLVISLYSKGMSGDVVEVGALGEVLADRAARVLVGGTLSGGCGDWRSGP